MAGLLLPLLLVLCASGAQAPAQSGPRVLAFVADPAPEAEAVTLAWHLSGAPEGGAQVSLERDGQEVFAGAAEGFVDEGVPPGRHRYLLRPLRPRAEPRSLWVTVPEPCAEAPALLLDEPRVDWPAPGRVVRLTVSGSLTQAPGCRALAVELRVADEAGGVLTSPMTLTAGRVRASVSLDVSPDWVSIEDAPVERRFLLSATASNQAGMATVQAGEVRVRGSS